MNIVGVSRVHNSSVCLLKDGEIVFHLENERLSNIKYDAYPFNVLAKLPEYVTHIDKIAIAGVGKTVPAECFTDHDVYTTFITRLNKKFHSEPIEVHDLWSQHHLMHAACAFYNSGFEKALCIIKDGVGSDFYINDSRFLPGTYGKENSSTFIAEYPAKFDLIDKHVVVPFNAKTIIEDNILVSDNLSEGLAFQKCSIMFGFHALDAGKVMGMSAYGVEDSNIPPIYDEDGLINKDLFCIDHRDLRNTYINVEKYPYLNTDNFQIQANFARALQLQTQQSVKKYILKMIKETRCKNVCLSGGYFLNCVANYEYLKDLPDDIKIYVEPISSDAGTAIGAAKYVWHKSTNDNTIRPQTNIYYGLKHSYTLETIEKTTIKENIIKNVTHRTVAELIANNNIVAIFQGRSESGPRALGHRSILFNPSNPDGKDIVNVVKQREWFRPFAGSVLEEHAKDWFEMRGLDSSPFMMYAVNVLPEKQSIVPAITHVDGTCRIQTVNEEQDKNFYNLIKEFYKITKIPILFNTSFNLAGDCIVETLDDAVDTIRRSKIKYLYLPEFSILIESN